MAVKTNNNTGAAKKASKRPRQVSPSGSSSSGSDRSQDDRAAMLAALEAHGRAMFGFDGPEEAESSEQGRKRLSGSFESGSGNEDESEEEDDDAEAFSSDDGWGEGDEMITDSEDEMMPASKPGQCYLLIVYIALTLSGQSCRTCVSRSGSRICRKDDGQIGDHLESG